MKREKYFTLNKNCFLIKGAKRGAIYDLESGNVFSVNEVSVKILEELDSWKEFKQVFQEDKNITEGKLVIYLNKLKKLGLGEWSEIY